MKAFKSRLAVVVLTAVSVGGGFIGYHFVQDVQFAKASIHLDALHLLRLIREESAGQHDGALADLELDACQGLFALR